MLDRVTVADKYDARELSRRAVKVWPTLRNLIVGMNGRPNGEIWRLNPEAIAPSFSVGCAGLVRCHCPSCFRRSASSCSLRP
jgi:hypothetical protein